MIFYFTGTGNSLFAAKRLLDEGEKLISIADAVKNGEYTYEAQKGEKVGFVFPVYFYSVPEFIRNFVSKLDLRGSEYIYAVITCGGGISQSGSVLKKALGKKGLRLDYVTSLLMPDNSMLFYQIPPVDEAGDRLSAATKKLAEIKKSINARETAKIGDSTILSSVVGSGFNMSNKTGKFYADEKCVGCGLCESVCPIGAIKLSDGKPKWVKDTCTKCSACINRCPKSAIQYGKATIKRNRYVNPEMK